MPQKRYKIKKYKSSGVDMESPQLWFNSNILRDTILRFVILNEYNFHL